MQPDNVFKNLKSQMILNMMKKKKHIKNVMKNVLNVQQEVLKQIIIVKNVLKDIILYIQNLDIVQVKKKNAQFAF